ncbi:MAG: hypothetical protein GY756_15895, partial [bacterium]|nr:hypothetical protein [bacterium]
FPSTINYWRKINNKHGNIVIIRNNYNYNEAIDELAFYFYRNIILSKYLTIEKSIEISRYYVHFMDNKNTSWKERLGQLHPFINLWDLNTPHIIIFDQTYEEFYIQFREEFPTKAFLIIWERQRSLHMEDVGPSFGVSKVNSDDEVCIYPLHQEESYQFINDDGCLLRDDLSEEFFNCDDSFDKLIIERVGCHPYLLKELCKELHTRIESDKSHLKNNKGIRERYLDSCFSGVLKSTLNKYISKYIEFINCCEPDIFDKLKHLIHNNISEVKKTDNEFEKLKRWGLLICNNNKFEIPSIIVSSFKERKKKEMHKLSKIINGREYIVYGPNATFIEWIHSSPLARE